MRKRLFVATLFIAGMTWSCAADTSDTFVFKDVLRPHGHDRSKAVKDADAIKCGWTRDGRVLTSESRMRRCMLSLGWTVSNYIPSADPPPGNSIVFTDLSRAGNRGDAELARAAEACDPQNTLNYLSKAFRACMRKKGWGYYTFNPPSAPAQDEDEDDTTPSSDPPDVSSPSPPVIDEPQPAYESPPAPDIHPFCPNPIC